MAGSENRAVTAGLLQGEKESLVLEKENGKLEGGKAGSQQSPLLLQSEDLVTEKTSLPVLGLCYRQGVPSFPSWAQFLLAQTPCCPG